MVRDIALNSDQDVYLDAGNDLALVAGNNTVVQSIAIAVGNVSELLVGERLRPQTIQTVEKEIRDALDSDPQVEQVLDVTVEEFDTTTDTLTVSVKLIGQEDIETPIPVGR